jgi:rod shape-determining protein MreC
METLISRYRNVTILVAILFVQVLGLAVQVKRNTENEPTRLIRIWAVNAVTPFEKAIVWTQSGVHNLWHSYVYLRGVRQENRDLKAEIERLRLQQVRLREDAEQARRLQLLLGFKEQFISQTLAAQVIGSSGSEQSRSIYIDKGEKAGITPDMAVITADGVVGKVLRVFGSTAQVLLIDDQTSGVGAILEKSRLQGILRGTPSGEVMLEKVMSDEAVQPGERVLTSGGDLVFPKGMPVGTVASVDKGKESFLNIRIKPAANLSKLEEVLVITKNEEKAPSVSENGSARAVDILAQRLPSVPEKAPVDASQPPPPTSGLTIAPAPAGTKPLATTGTATPKPPPKPTQGVANSTAKATLPGTAPTSAQIPPITAPKPRSTGTPAAASNQPAGSAAGTIKPSTGSAAVTPATAQKPAPAAVNVSDVTTKSVTTKPAGSVTKPAANPVKPAPKPATPPAASPSTQPPAPEDKPQ